MSNEDITIERLLSRISQTAKKGVEKKLLNDIVESTPTAMSYKDESVVIDEATDARLFWMINKKFVPFPF